MPAFCLGDMLQPFQETSEGLTGTTATGEVLRVREVWDDNLEQEFELLRNVVEQYPFVAMDTEFPGVVARYAISVERVALRHLSGDSSTAGQWGTSNLVESIITRLSR